MGAGGLGGRRPALVLRRQRALWCSPGRGRARAGVGQEHVVVAREACGGWGAHRVQVLCPGLGDRPPTTDLPRECCTHPEPRSPDASSRKPRSAMKKRRKRPMEDAMLDSDLRSRELTHVTRD